jgi:hypothetical protein
MRNSKQTVELVLSTLNKFSDKINNGASFIFQQYVKDAYWSGVQDILFCGLFAFFGILAYRYFQKTKNNKDDWDNLQVRTIIALVVFPLCFITSALLFGNGLECIFNPYFTAIQTLLSNFNVH